MKTSKRLRSAYENVDTMKIYDLSEAVKILKSTATVKFDATAELHIKLDIDPRQADQQVRTTTSLPNGTGKTVRVVVVTSDNKWAEAKKAGAVEAGSVELIEKIAGGWTDFDVLVATPDMMRNLAKVARTLGPKGLMPSPKAGTVTTDITKTVGELVAGRLEFRNDKAGVIHTIFGKMSFSEDKLLENLEAMVKAVKDAKPSGVKGTYIKSMSINSTMGPGIKIVV